MVALRGKTNAEYVREELNKDFDAPAATIVGRLQGIGINITNQDVYAQRNFLRTRRKSIQDKRNKKKELNQVPLAEYITALLSQKETMSDYELMEAVKQQGYVTHSDDFIAVLRQKLRSMVENRLLAKEGTQYSLTIRAKAEAEVPAEAKNEESDYSLLCQAVVTFAKAKGIKNPESLPQSLIENQKKFGNVQKLIAAQREVIANAEREALELSLASLNIFKDKE